MLRSLVRLHWVAFPVALAAACGSPVYTPDASIAGGGDAALPGPAPDGGGAGADGPGSVAGDQAAGPTDASAPGVDAGGPSTPDLAGGPSAPDLASGPSTPDLAGGPSAPDLASGPSTPDLASGPSTPDLAGGPSTPDLAGGPSTPDLATLPKPDLAQAPQPDLATSKPDMTSTNVGDTSYVPPGNDDHVLVHGAATPIAVTKLGAGVAFLDVGADAGGGTWAVTPTKVYYFAPSGSTYTYTAAGNGLARGNGANTFAAVGGGLSGEAYVGNRGAIGDHLVVDPATGAVLKVENMVVPFSNTPEYQEHLKRVVAGIRVLVDRNGTFNGTAYLGGTHGTTAWHGVDGSCGCMQFQEHQHYIPIDCDSTGPQGGCWGGDTSGLAVAPNGDLWIGDEHFVALLPQRSKGPSTDFFESFTLGIDVFPKANDEVHALATDAAGGVWVASFGQGLAYLAPMTFQPSYFDRSRQLPQNRLTGVAVDPDGSVWIATVGGGVVRKQGSTWTYYTQASGLPSDDVNALFIDTSSKPRRVLIATDFGIGVYTGP